MISWIVLAVVAAVLVYAVVIYNGLVRNRQMAKEGWSGIDVQLKRRADLIPNLVETVKGYAAHERQTLDAVTAARAAATAVPSDDVAGRARAEGVLSAALGRLVAVAEAYPDLKASQTFLDLQGQLGQVENDLSMARRYYNGAARNLNIQVESFPSNLVASQFRFAPMPYFEIETAADRQVPKVGF